MKSGKAKARAVIRHVKGELTTRALVIRINRRLTEKGQRLLRKSFVHPHGHEIIDYYIVRTADNWTLKHVELEALGRELGVLGPGDRVAD